MAAANVWLPGFISAYNARFGRDPANAKNLHRPLAQADDLNEILAWREERTVTHNLTLHYDRMMLLLDPTTLAGGLAGKRVEVMNYPDERFAAQFNRTALDFKYSTRSRQCRPARLSTTTGCQPCWSRSSRSRLCTRRVSSEGTLRDSDRP